MVPMSQIYYTGVLLKLFQNVTPIIYKIILFLN